MANNTHGANGGQQGLIRKATICTVRKEPTLGDATLWYDPSATPTELANWEVPEKAEVSIDATTEMVERQNYNEDYVDKEQVRTKEAISGSFKTEIIPQNGGVGRLNSHIMLTNAFQGFLENGVTPHDAGVADLDAGVHLNLITDPTVFQSDGTTVVATNEIVVDADHTVDGVSGLGTIAGNASVYYVKPIRTGAVNETFQLHCWEGGSSDKVILGYGLMVSDLTIAMPQRNIMTLTYTMDGIGWNEAAPAGTPVIPVGITTDPYEPPPENVVEALPYISRCGNISVLPKGETVPIELAITDATISLKNTIANLEPHNTGCKNGVSSNSVSGRVITGKSLEITGKATYGSEKADFTEQSFRQMLKNEINMRLFMGFAKEDGTQLAIEVPRMKITKVDVALNGEIFEVSFTAMGYTLHDSTSDKDQHLMLLAFKP